jgi:hypothetical protein
VERLCCQMHIKVKIMDEEEEKEDRLLMAESINSMNTTLDTNYIKTMRSQNCVLSSFQGLDKELHLHSFLCVLFP